ncbi:MAG: histidine--tRNA ligase [Chitinophagaceae bacterium]
MKPSIPQGTRDFDALQVAKRQYIFSTIQKQFALFGFQALETPAFENMETLMGKYGDEGDKLLFKILNNGLDREEKKENARQDFEKILAGKNTKGITERALKYDLTIPLARYVAMHYGQLTYPFKRYQIQPVWRADRPQRGRYREFYQCDADVVGSTSLINEIELLQVYTNVFEALGISVKICINNRKILQALAQFCQNDLALTAMTVAIDKLDKIGEEKVLDEIRKIGFSEEQVKNVEDYLKANLLEDNNDKIQQLKKLFGDIDIAKEGIEELQYVLNNQPKASLDLTLARGLNYYTGTIVEVKPQGIQMGSIGGGGRYDNLTELFGVSNMPGVGISFGVDRIYDVMEELNLFPEQINTQTDVLFINFGLEYQTHCLQTMNHLRQHQISCELYADPVKMDKQMKYANKKGFRFVIMLGENEIKNQTITIKNFKSGEQKSISMAEAITWITNSNV